MRISRAFLRLIRLALRFATHPFSNWIRAFAMSSVFERTLIPTLSILAIGDLTSASTIPMSWIMRSSTTPTSVPRTWYGRQPLGRDVLRPVRLLLEEGHDRVEMLDVADLDEAVPRPGRGEDPLRLLQGGAEGLLDQQVAAARKERERDLLVPVRRNDDGDGVARRAPARRATRSCRQPNLALISAARASDLS